MTELISSLSLSQNALFTLIAAAGFVFCFWLFGVVISRKLIPLILKYIRIEKHAFFHLFLKGFNYPIFAFLLLLGIYFGLYLFTGLQDPNLPSWLISALSKLPPLLNKTMRIALIVCITWGLMASSDIVNLLVRNARSRMQMLEDSSFTRFLTGFYRVMVIALSLVILLSELGYNINGLITGLGLGGLTVALAAKDSAANLFGGLILVIDKPFEIGDWVSCTSVEGTVEDINMRNTIIRNDSGALTTMPNAMLSAEPITNFSSAMEQRRADITLTLLYSTTRKEMETFIASIHNLLEKDEEILPDRFLVCFSEFGDSSLNVRLIFYTTIPGYFDYLRICERINFAIMSLAEEQGIGFAYPTQTLQMDEDSALHVQVHQSMSSPQNDTTTAEP